MIKLKTILKEEEEYKIYCDMDDVLTDMAQQFYNYYPKYEKIRNKVDDNAISDYLGKNKFWDLIDKIGLKFWSDMPWTNDGRLLWNYINQYDVEILSAPAKMNESKRGKILWCKRELGPNIKVNLVPSKRKQVFASENRILIDDRTENIKQWKNRGGIGILHTDANSTIAQLKELGL